MISLFRHHKTEESTPVVSAPKIMPILRIAVCATADDATESFGRTIAAGLASVDAFEVDYVDYTPAASSLYINAKNLLEFPDFVAKVSRKKSYEVTIFGHVENNMVCLNFFTAKEFESLEVRKWRVFDCLYLPISFFEAGLNESAKNLIIGALLLCKSPTNIEDRTLYGSLLKKTVDFLSKDEAAGNVPFGCMPYILNLLGSLYLEYFSNRMNKQSFSNIKFIFEKTLEHKMAFAQKIHLASVYIHLGNMFAAAAKNLDADINICTGKAISAYRLAQGYFTQTTYPYEYAWISYLCAETFLQKWLSAKDVESLRESISSLQSAKKIYTEKAYPFVYAKIEQSLGQNLLALGAVTGSPEILNMSANAMSSAQNIFSRNKYPAQWIELQEGIGNAYYAFGKKYRDTDFLKKAEKCLHEAIAACEETNQTALLRKLDIELSKVSELLYKTNKISM